MSYHHDLRDELARVVDDARERLDRAVARADAAAAMLDIALGAGDDRPLYDVDDLERCLDELGRARWRAACRALLAVPDDEDDELELDDQQDPDNQGEPNR